MGEFASVGITLIATGIMLVLGAFALWAILEWHQGRSPTRQLKSARSRRQRRKSCAHKTDDYLWRPDFGSSPYWFCAWCGKTSWHEPLPQHSDVRED